MALRRAPRVSTPGEHGGLVILIGSTALGVAVAPQRLAALAAGLAMVVGYMARGPIERRARRFRPRAWDAQATAIYALLASGATALIAWRDPTAAALVAGIAIGFPLVGSAVTRARVQRSAAVELVALALCGAVTGAISNAGAAPLSQSAYLGLLMAVYGASTVGIVRSETRREQGKGRRWGLVAVLLLGAGIAVLGLSHGWLALALAPRCVHATVRLIAQPRRLAIKKVALRECAELTGVVVLAALGLQW